MNETDDDLRDRQPIWCDGSIVPANEFRIDPRDPALQFGLGLFETTRTCGHRPWLWERHIERLARSARTFLGIELAQKIPTADEVARFALHLGHGDVVIRLNVSPGIDRKPLVWMLARPLPEPVETVTLAVSSHKISPSDPVAAHKCFNYALRHLAHVEACREGHATALLADTDGNLLEGAIANLFVRVSGEWVTPPGIAIVPGTVRGLLLDHHSEIRERSIPVASLAEVEAVFLCNSVRGILPVNQVGDIEFPTSNDLFANFQGTVETSLRKLA